MEVVRGGEPHVQLITIDLNGAQKRETRAAQPIVRYAVAQQALKGEVGAKSFQSTVGHPEPC